ncbi:MAG: 50S ribosomal protein L9 [Cytophagales bacterium]|nr:50S ribosomal protein L9 [Armatimonadota bacterium]
MKIILQQDVLKVGKEGEVVTVADGYARNYLFPRRLAIEAVGGALKNIQMRHALEERRTEKLKAQADQNAVALEGKTVKVPGKSGAGDRLYGSITAQDIADAIQNSLSIAVDKRKVQIQNPIKALGTFTVPIKLHRDVTVPLTIEVVKAA